MGDIIIISNLAFVSAYTTQLANLNLAEFEGDGVILHKTSLLVVELNSGLLSNLVWLY